MTDRSKPHYFSLVDILLWSLSVLLCLLSYICFRTSSPLSLAASLVGVTSLILLAKGNPIGQALMIVFSVLYAILSYTQAYYGEMLTYLGMTAPMALVSLIAWLRHPYRGRRAEVEVRALTRRDIRSLVLLSVPVTVGFYFLLRYFGTASLAVSTLSVLTSFVAVYLTFIRNPFFALAYAANDAVLIVLWAVASAQDRQYLGVLVCFVAFLFNDLYGFISWRRMQRRQGMSDE